MGGLTTSSTKPEGVTPLDVIFSCHICSATCAEVYAGHHETVQGFTDGINPKERLVTKLFLTQCCHVVCSKHLENGAPPFHKSGTRPSAPCPICIKEKGDAQNRDLYSIRGFQKGEYDDVLSPDWFIAPPRMLDANGAEMEALRFQYASLLRYSMQNATDRTVVEAELKDTKKKCTIMHDKVAFLQQENERLRVAEAELQRRKEQDSVIKENLRRVGELAECVLIHVPVSRRDNLQMRQQLEKLRCQPPAEPQAYDQDPYRFYEEECLPMDYSDESMASPNQALSSRTVGRSTHTDYSGENLAAPSSQTRPLKRQRVDSPLPERNIHALPPRSRDMMPPPQKPFSRMKSMKRFFPTIRKKLSRDPYLSAMNSEIIPDDDVQTHKNGYWESSVQPENYSNSNSYERDRGVRGGTPYMTGALPIGYPPRSNNSPSHQQHPQADQAEFSFRMPSPVKAADGRPRSRPTEPSYIQLMDGLSYDSGLQLGLRDPRRHASQNDQQPRLNNSTHSGRHSPTRCRESDRSKRWGFGHAFLHQSPNGATSASYRHPDPLRSNPTVHGIPQSHARPSAIATTPAPHRLTQPPRGESVITSFRRLSLSKTDGSPARLA
ncbi:hypothetical protein K504DRAFT_431651 [Pleomassaria siparia CBS 279.74]|uniref:Uncharacterized protein n=1 Tax=Pleomassaria siparia CBS 279.74 TaxID=1314801 RepID=A0A6G1K8R2_9PLEO|nr:hypothetical protein K504DRAFT_431651 [Pleomassaria siparia CBS 279.74]